jgi:hypothetical protein
LSGAATLPEDTRGSQSQQQRASGKGTRLDESSSNQGNLVSFLLMSPNRGRGFAT